jgi:ribosome-binding factor A
VSNRTVRINELVQRELNGILRRRYQEESVAITITEVRIAPDLRDGKVRVAIVGNDEAVERGMVWLRRKSAEIREELGKLITLKFLPKLVYALDETTPRSARVLAMLDDMDKISPVTPAVTAPPPVAETPAADPAP